MPEMISDEELYSELRRLNKETKGKVMQKHIIQDENLALQTIQRRLGGVDEALEKAGADLPKKKLFQQWKYELEGLHGYYKHPELKELLETSPSMLERNKFEFEEWAEEQDDFYFRASKSPCSGRRYFVTDGYGEWIIQHLQDVPQKYRSQFKKIVGQGCMPEAVKAAIERVETGNSYAEIADEFGCSSAAVRHNTERLKELINNGAD